MIFSPNVPVAQTHPHTHTYSECSQKLMIWKNDETKRKKRDKRKCAIPKLIVTTIEKEAIVDNNSKKIQKKKYENYSIFHFGCEKKFFFPLQ